MNPFTQRLTGALLGGAIGDAMGAPVEGWGPKSILEHFADWNFAHFIPPQGWDGHSHYWKGNGRITDDTLMTEALIHAYIHAQDHLDAYGYAKYLIPQLVRAVAWVPEYQKDMPIFERLWLPEKYPRWRLEVSSADPRSAGIGNMCNCGVAMWIMPVGAVNAGDPHAAYHEAAAIGLAHNESFAVEAAAVLAAAYAQALAAQTSIESTITTAISLAQDGTRRACAAALRAANPADSLPAFIDHVRNAVAPFDQRTEHTADDKPLVTPTEPSDLGRPSRTKSIEELPVALAALHYGQGDFLKTLRAAVSYGRDCDSIASMAAGLFGAIHGPAQFPPSLTTALTEANRRDFPTLAANFTTTIHTIHQRDLTRQTSRQQALHGL